jgi:hypothetical protein
MKLEYEPLLRVQREIQGMPMGRERFWEYLRKIFNCYETDFELIPLLIANPMGKAHVTALLDHLLELDADRIAAAAAKEASANLADVPGEVKAAIVVADDLKGGWTNRYDYEFTLRFGKPRDPDRSRLPRAAALRPPNWSKFIWIIGVLWSSEPATAHAVREAMLTATYRFGFIQRHGLPQTLGEMLVQEGQVMARAGCTTPVLDEEDLAYTREVLAPHLGSGDMRTCIECLFGDAAGKTLGFEPRGLSPWAGLALALDDGRGNVTM